LGVYDVLTGPPIDQIAQAESRAAPGQIVLTPEASATVGERFRQEQIGGGFTRLASTIVAPTLPGSTRWPSIRWLDHVDRAWELVEACRPYLPAPLYERLLSGHGTYMTDLRTVTPLFMRFSGLDYTAPEAGTQLDELVRAAQMIVSQHGGYLSEVNVGEKGSVMVALFGAPVALENPAARAAQATLILHQELPHITGLQIGITCGKLFAGTVGGPMRRAYAVIGDEVILAARLMIRARPGETLANGLAQEMADEFSWQTLPPMRLKGKIAPTRVYRLLNVVTMREPLLPAGRIIARTNEITALDWAVKAVQENQRRLLIMVGEPGLGKSHLISEFAAMLRERGITTLMGAGRSVEQQIPYRTWRDVFTNYFDLNRETSLDQRREQVLGRLAQIAPELVQHAPLLNDILQLDYPEDAHTQALEPAARHTALVKLLVTLLQAWLDEDALGLVIDNVQWLDTLSWDLLYRITQQIADRPLSILVSMRPFVERPPVVFTELHALPHVRQLVLAPLSMEDAALLATAHLGVDRLPESLRQLIIQRAGGNPLFIKEIATMLRESGTIAVQDGEAVIKGDPQDLQLPDTIQGVVRSRIDRLPPDQQVLLKVASVIGMQFGFQTLEDVHPLHLAEDALRANIDALCEHDLQLVDTLEDDLVYTFRYATTREVAYGSLSFFQRRQLHRAVALWYEHRYQDNLAAYYSLLAHHWHEAEHQSYERHYSFLAGVQAAAQSANDNAIGYLERALDLTPDDRPDLRIETLLHLEALYHLGGDRERQLTTLDRLSALVALPLASAAQQAEVETRWSGYCLSIAAYDASIEAATRAFTLAESAGLRHLMGLSSVHRGQALLGQGRYPEACEQLNRVYAEEDNDIEALRNNAIGAARLQAGTLDEAQEAFASALAHAEAAGDRSAIAEAHDFLGRIYETLGDYEQAIWFYRRALAVRREIGERQGEATTLTQTGTLALRTGDFELARRLLEQAREAHLAVGARAGEAEALNRLGRLAYERGDYEGAAELLVQARDILSEVGDHLGVGRVLVDLAMTATARDDMREAEHYLGEALAVEEEMNRQEALERFVCFGLMGLLALRLGNAEAALAHIEAVLEAVETHGLVAIPYAVDISLICHDVLTVSDDNERAHQILRAAYDLVMSRADRIIDLERRTRYLLTVPGNREIIARFEAKA
ncbi:MAG: tetratricopeptide repeat protein, partial [Anaerolineae bacterium]|nr:tetratricopeptide repeat protein [Anaerolineae bacterium]